MSVGSFPITAGPAALPAAVFLFLVPEADELPAAAVAGQAVWLPAAVMVPPLVTALATAENLFLGMGRLLQGFSAVSAHIRSVIFCMADMDSIAVADGFYCILGKRQKIGNLCKRHPFPAHG